MFEFNTNEGYFLHLLKCALKTEQPLEPPKEIDFEKVLELSRRHDVENLTFLSIDQLQSKLSDELYAHWQELYYKDQKRTLFQDMALEELIDAFTKAGIDCMPLKGSVIKNYYPNPDLRSMGDIDFLVREQNRQVVRDIMHSLGYEDDILDDGQVDGFKKGKLTYIEIHYDFSAENHIMHDVFTIDWSKLVPTGVEHLWEMTFEDLYFFNTGHYVKNMHNKGMGLRGVVDTYILWNRLSDEEKSSLQARFEKVELDEFNSKLVKISEIWFNNAEDDTTLDTLQEYLMAKKTYGDKETQTILYTLFSFESKSKSNFYLKRIFPSAKDLYGRFGVKHKCFVLLPFLWIARLFVLILGGKNKLNDAKAQIESFDSISQADIDYERKVRQDFGLMK